MAKKDDSIYAPSPGRSGFDARHDGDEGRGPLLLVVALAVLLAFAAVVYTAYHQGLRKGGRNAAPHVTAEPGPIKVRPTESHGTPTPNLGNRAYEPLDDVEAAPAEDITVAPLGEKLLPRPTKVEVPSSTPKAVEAKPDPVPVQARPEPKPVTKRETKLAATDGKFVVQIASFRSEDQALAAWARLAGRMSASVSSLAPDVQRADLGAKGVYYRLRAASFPTRAAATGFCDQLKKNGSDCLVVRR